MKKLSEEAKKEVRRLRDISDYIHSCIRRGENHIEFIASLKRNKRLFSKKHRVVTLSLCDVYSRDIIITLSHIIDQDPNTSSLFSLVASIKRPRKRKEFHNRLKLIKAGLNALVRVRGNQVGHFNTKHNVFENGLPHIHMMFMVMRPRDTRKILKELEAFYWDVKEELKINGVFMFVAGNLTDEFQKKWLPR